MSLAEIAPTLAQTLEARGLHFDRFVVPGDLLTFVSPRGWTPTWKEDHASVHHGVPPKGWLTVYPVPLRQTVSSEGLLGAFLDEFVAPAAQHLHMLQTGHLERLPALEVAEFRLHLAGRTFMGLAVASAGVSQGRVVSYWVEEPLFRRALVEDLLLAVLGSIEAPPGSPFREKPTDIPEISAAMVWQEASLEVRTPFGAQAGRFAVRLPDGWQGHEVSFEGQVGWLIVPPDSDPGIEGAPLISISGADLLTSLDETLDDALASLVDREVYQLEHAPQAVDVRGQHGLVQLWIGRPPGRPGEAWRLWSLGLTDGSSVVHLFALAEAGRLEALLPGLNAIGGSLKVLPRQANVDLMGRLGGFWRFLDTQDKGTEAFESCLHLRADGTFGMTQRSVDPKASVTDRPSLDGARERTDGSWEVVDTTLSLNRPDGSREIFEIESVADRSAIVGRTFWERLG